MYVWKGGEGVCGGGEGGGVRRMRGGGGRGGARRRMEGVGGRRSRRRWPR